MDFNIIGAIIVIVSLAAYATVHFTRASRQERINDTLPVETVRARVKANNPIRLRPRSDKRIFLTFETEKGKMKFSFSPRNYTALNLRVLNNGDAGTLYHQGTRYINFITEIEYDSIWDV